ncbi:MAG: G5 domain-containing protein [Clostridia bacterium]|nr:G5 domain-containing protein [Clostridia bacterium]
MKKRTGAHSAMAELLSKSNETQIKDKEASSAPVRRPAPAKRPESSKNGAGVQSRPAHMSAQTIQRPTVTAQTTQRPTVTAQTTQRPLKGAQTVQHPSERIRKQNDTVHNPAMGYAPIQRNSSDAARRTTAIKKKKSKKGFKAPKIIIPVKAVVGAVSAVAIVGIVAFVAVIVHSTISEATFEPDAFIGNELEIMENADSFNIKDSDDAKHDGRNYVTISVFEKEELVCSTGASTVGEILADMKVKVEGDYVLRGSETDSVTSDKVVYVDKITYGTVTEESSVPFETKYVDVQTIARGKTKVVKAGANGVSTATYKVTYVNGVESERVLESQVITKQPTTQVVNRGVGGTITIGGKTYSYSHYIDCKTTVYTGGGTTASGLPATEAVIAVDPRVIPLGTKVYVADSYCYVGIRTAADTGGVIKGNFIDIYFDEDNPSLWGYGVRSARVYILD